MSFYVLESPTVPVCVVTCSSLFKPQRKKEVDEPCFIQAFIYLFTTTFPRVAVLEAHVGSDPRYSHSAHSGSHYVHTACTPVLENPWPVGGALLRLSMKKESFSSEEKEKKTLHV